MDIAHESILPMRINESGREDEAVEEVIFCVSLSGGADYKNDMPVGLTLIRRLADGTEHRMRYSQVTSPAP